MNWLERQADGGRQAVHLRSLVRVGRVVAYWLLEQTVTTLQVCWPGASWYCVTPSQGLHLRSREVVGDKACSVPTPHTVQTLQDF